jgi:predicted permease
MSTLRQFASRIRNTFLRRRSDSHLEEELQSHFELLVEQNLRRGLPLAEARRLARLSLGGTEQIKESVQDHRGLPLIESLWQDIRYGARMLRKTPGFTLVTILTLALGIGANAAIFTLTYAVILRSLPVPNPQQLVRYTFRNGAQEIGLSGPLYDALRKNESTNQDLLAWSSSTFDVQENDVTTKVHGALISGNGFRVLELQPALGRTFGDGDDVSGGGPNGYQAVISDSYWKAHFAGRADIAGQSLAINGKSATIIGVLPAGFDGLVSGQHADVILPLAFDDVSHPNQPMRHYAGSFWLTVTGRLNPGESLRSAQANLQATANSVREEADPSNAFLKGFFSAFQLGVESGRAGRSFLRVTYARPLFALEFLVGLLMLLCCANTALLVLARVSSRMREFAVRSALGAPRVRLFRQVLAEIGLLAFIGLLAGIMLGWAGAEFLVSMITSIGQPSPLDVTPRVAILAFTGAISVFSALAAGAWPARRASLVSPLLGLKEVSASGATKIVGRWIVPSQVAISVVLLAAASLLGGSLLHLLLEDSGFRPDGAVMADVDLSATKPDRATSTRIAQQFVDALSQSPGIVSVAALDLPPIHTWWSASHYYAIGTNGAIRSDMNSWAETVTPRYFEAMGTSLLEGRPFTTADNAGEQVCILSVSAARYFFPGEDALGHFIFSGGAAASDDGKSKASADDTYRVIGIAADARFRSLREPAPRMLYLMPRNAGFGGEFFVVARGANSAAISSAVRDAARRVIPAAAPPSIFTFNKLIAEHLTQERMLTALSACFAAIALLLTVMGLYGLLARYVDLRTKEIGLRLALGARPRDALSLVLSQCLRLVVLGAVAGVAVSLFALRLLKSLLFAVSATSPLIFAIVVAVLLAVALLACAIPARRAMRVDPMVALRYE